jgi:hypothetical protein
MEEKSFQERESGEVLRDIIFGGTRNNISGFEGS